MKNVSDGLQEAIDKCVDIYEIEEELTGWGLDWDEEYTFTFQGKNYQFMLVDSGKSDEPQNGNYPEVINFKEIKRKYWYLLTIESCVLCGRETKSRERVYHENLKGVNWIENACGEHFM